MKTVAIRELKNRLSAYLREVRAGEVLLVTDRGEVVAELRPPTFLAAGQGKMSAQVAALLRMVEEGIVRPGYPVDDPKKVYRMPSFRSPEGTAQRALDAEREERVPVPRKKR